MSAFGWERDGYRQMALRSLMTQSSRKPFSYNTIPRDMVASEISRLCVEQKSKLDEEG